MTASNEDTSCYRILKTTSRVTLNVYEPSTFYLYFPVVKNKKEFTSQQWKFFWNPRIDELADDALCYFIELSGDCAGSRNAKSYFHVKLFKSNHELLLASSSKVKSYMPSPHYNTLHINWNQRLDAELKEQLKNVVYLQIMLCSDPDEFPKSFESTKRMLDDGIMTDFVIKTKGKDFPCHKFMLAAESEYFRTMFETDMMEKEENAVNWVDIVDQDTVQDMLHYIYAGQTPPKLKDTCFALMEVATMCLMEDLKRLCAIHISEILSVDNMGEILRLAAKLESNQLQEMVVNFVVDNYDLHGDSPPPWDVLEPELAKTLMGSVLRVMVAKKLYI